MPVDKHTWHSDNLQHTALYYAGERGFNEIVDKLLENGVLNIDLPKFSEQEKEKAKRFIDVQ